MGHPTGLAPSPLTGTVGLGSLRRPCSVSGGRSNGARGPTVHTSSPAAAAVSSAREYGSPVASQHGCEVSSQGPIRVLCQVTIRRTVGPLTPSSSPVRRGSGWVCLSTCCPSGTWLLPSLLGALPDGSRCPSPSCFRQLPRAAAQDCVSKGTRLPPAPHTSLPGRDWQPSPWTGNIDRHRASAEGLFAGPACPVAGFAIFKNWEGHVFPDFLTHLCHHLPLALTQLMGILLSSCSWPRGSEEAGHRGCGGPGPGREGRTVRVNWGQHFLGQAQSEGSIFGARQETPQWGMEGRS